MGKAKEQTTYQKIKKLLYPYFMAVCIMGLFAMPFLILKFEADMNTSLGYEYGCPEGMELRTGLKPTWTELDGMKEYRYCTDGVNTKEVGWYSHSNPR